MEKLEQIVEDTAVELLRISATELHKDVVKELKKVKEQTKGALGRPQLENILNNIESARKRSLPMCQDTGIVSFVVKLGDEFPIRSKLKEILVKATRRATEEVPLRPNAVDVFEGNTGDNVGKNGYVPHFYTNLVEGNKLELTAMPKGGGSSNVAALKMLKPGVGIKGVKEFVIQAVAAAGSLGCPPYSVGVGVGGGEDICMHLGKKALLKPVGERNPDPNVAELEKELLEKINELNVGAMGLGEGPTAFDVHFEIAARHPASLPVGVVISCWALRHAKATISSNGEVTIRKNI
ncbi:MAG: fumarate hydratase [Thermoproteota archaeon]|nr:fumarate hydratase [Thermoproteota archaeon]